MDHPLPTVNLHNLTFTAFVRASHHLNLVVFSHGNGSGVVFGAEVVGEWCAH
ncbi:hypothetical protein HanRHA438_Chr12g0562181 [Helianthus annuus]|nr:hypothetical protein HanRHA438_Chr12g0562181 [Helianthus annuus]